MKRGVRGGTVRRIAYARMRLPRILSRYLLRETLQYAALGLFGVAAILLTQNLLREIDELAVVGVGPADTLEVLGHLASMLLSYAVPVAFLFGVVVAMSRLSADSETTAMRALGVSLAQIASPILLLALLVSGSTAYLLHSVEPSARRDLRALFSEIAARGGLIEPGEFNALDGSGERLLFVDRRGEGNRLHGVFIADRSNPRQSFTVAAERGRFVYEARTATGHLKLRSGDIHLDPDGEGAAEESYRQIAFERFDYAVDLSELLGASIEQIRPREMSTGTVLRVLEHFDREGEAPENVRDERRERYAIQLHRRMALPFAPLLFALVGIPLGLRRSRGARSWGALLCVALVFGYYLLLSVGVYLAEERALPASTGLWIPNAAFAVCGAWLLWRARRAEV